MPQSLVLASLLYPGYFRTSFQNIQFLLLAVLSSFPPLISTVSFYKLSLEMFPMWFRLPYMSIPSSLMQSPHRQSRIS
ncbi:hypothetical protein ID866_12995 [Astraeus odoratus]|nr:hypothetical protein ID866_12995 [Astraeus odoratus]